MGVLENFHKDIKVIHKIVFILGHTSNLTLLIHPHYQTIHKLHQHEYNSSKLKMITPKWSP